MFDFFLSTNGNACSRLVDTKQAWQGGTTARQVFRIDTRENNRRVLRNDTREMQQKGEVRYTPTSRHLVTFRRTATPLGARVHYERSRKTLQKVTRSSFE